MTTSEAAAFTRGAELAGKVALVTGASRNIGRAIARALAAGGAAVAVNALSSRNEADGVAAEIRAAGGQAEVFMADIADGAAVKAMVAGVLHRFGRIDMLVLNASVRTEKPFTELSYDEWRLPLAITLDGAFHLTQACIPEMIKAGGGSIVTLGGLNSLSGAKKRVHGSVAKHGLVGMTRALAREFAGHGIRANCVAPGRMSTIRAASANRTPEPGVEKMIPLGRKGEPAEIAATVRFLCGPGASFITGQTVHVNGGQSMF